MSVNPIKLKLKEGKNSTNCPYQWIEILCVAGQYLLCDTNEGFGIVNAEHLKIDCSLFDLLTE